MFLITGETERMCVCVWGGRGAVGNLGEETSGFSAIRVLFSRVGTQASLKNGKKRHIAGMQFEFRVGVPSQQ